jgi:nuclease HARBI1
MVEALDLPEYIVTPLQFVFDPVEALGLTLTCFHSAGDQYELSMLYNCTQSAISEIMNFVVTYVDNHWSDLLDFDHNHLLSLTNLKKCAAAIHQAGAPMDSIWGFIDCMI